LAIPTSIVFNIVTVVPELVENFVTDKFLSDPACVRPTRTSTLYAIRLISAILIVS